MGDNIHSHVSWQTSPPSDKAMPPMAATTAFQVGFGGNHPDNFDDSTSYKRTYEDSGYYGDGKATINQQCQPTTLSAKWDKWLHTWYLGNGCKLPSDEELLFFRGLIREPERDIRARFIQFDQRENSQCFPFGTKNTDEGRQKSAHEQFDHTSLTDESNLDLTSRPLALSNVTSHPLTQNDASGEAATDGRHHSTLPQFQSQLWSDVNQFQILNNTTQSMQSVKRVTLTRSLKSLVRTVYENKKRTGCGRIRNHEKRAGNYHCTLRCGRQFNSPCDLFRHENLTYMQDLWFCTRCGDPDNASEQHLFVRYDKFREHLRRRHPDWSSARRLRDCKLPQSPIPYPSTCGFCDRNTFHAGNWSHRCNHISSHFKNGDTITAWRDWAEDSDGEEEPSEDWQNSGGADDDADDDDDDDDDEDNDNGNGGDSFGNNDSNNDPSLGPGGNGFSAPFNPYLNHHDTVLEDFLSDWGSTTTFNRTTKVALFPLESFVNNDSQIPQPHLLPIRWWTEKINPKGGTSSIYKVSIPSSAIQQWAVNTATNQNLSLDFAVKQYSSQHYDSFERELKAFTYLDGTDGVLKCFGSFTLLDSQGGKIYNLLLELADSDLADYWARTPRPRKGEIRLYWRSLVPVINALQHIHTLKPRLDNPYHLYGWHGDIKPDNILMVKGEFKLADFGFSKFTEPDGRAVADIEQTLDGGTHVYGAPELSHTRWSASSAPVSQSIDIWALGCVFSEAAIWIAKGLEGLRDFKAVRKSACREIHGTRAPPAFHDGEKILSVVRRLFTELQDTDPISKHVLDFIGKHVLCGDPRMRCTSKEMFQHLAQLIGPPSKVTSMSQSILWLSTTSINCSEAFAYERLEMEATGALHKVLQHSEDTIIVLGAQIIETAATRDMLHLLAHDPRLHILMVRVVNTLGLNTKEPLFNVLSRAFLCHCNRHHSVHTLYHAEVRTQLYRDILDERILGIARAQGTYSNHELIRSLSELLAETLSSPWQLRGTRQHMDECCYCIRNVD